MKTLVLKLGIRGLQFGDVKHKKKLPNDLEGTFHSPISSVLLYHNFFWGDQKVHLLQRIFV